MVRENLAYLSCFASECNLYSLLEESNEKFDLTYIPEVDSKRSQICNHAWGQKHIASDPVVSVAKHTRSFGPAVFLATQSPNQFFCSI